MNKKEIWQTFNIVVSILCFISALLLLFGTDKVFYVFYSFILVLLSGLNFIVNVVLVK